MSARDPLSRFREAEADGPERRVLRRLYPEVAALHDVETEKARKAARGDAVISRDALAHLVRDQFAAITSKRAAAAMVRQDGTKGRVKSVFDIFRDMDDDGSGEVRRRFSPRHATPL